MGKEKTVRGSRTVPFCADKRFYGLLDRFLDRFLVVVVTFVVVTIVVVLGHLLANLVHVKLVDLADEVAEDIFGQRTRL